MAIALDCPTGLLPLRLVTVSGITELKLFSIGNCPEISEAEPNGDAKQPQTVTLPVTINGTITSEDIDYFAFTAAKDQRLNFEIEAMRLGARDYVEKPWENASLLARLATQVELGRALRRASRLEDENALLRAEGAPSLIGRRLPITSTSRPSAVTTWRPAITRRRSPSAECASNALLGSMESTSHPPPPAAWYRVSRSSAPSWLPSVSTTAYRAPEPSPSSSSTR